MKKSKNFTKKCVSSTYNADEAIQYELELCWCLHQLENALNSGTLNHKTAEDTGKYMRTLKNQSAPIIKKRQVMRNVFGDYRTKMKDEDKQNAFASKQIKFTEAFDVRPKSMSFIKKSSNLSSDHFVTQQHKVINDNIRKAQDYKTTTKKEVTLQSCPENSFKFNFL